MKKKKDKNKDHKPNYFGILPAPVRYADEKKVVPRAKILFSEVSALWNLWGYCNASNSYFAGLYGVKDATVSNWITSLEKEKFFRIEYERWPGKVAVKERKIYPGPGIIVSPKPTSEEKAGTSEGEKPTSQGKEPTSQGPKENKKKEKEEIKEGMTFEDFWNKYGKKVGKANAEKKWKKLSRKDRDDIAATLDLYLGRTIVKEDWDTKRPFKPMRKDPATYLNQRVWEDFDGDDLNVHEAEKNRQKNKPRKTTLQADQEDLKKPDVDPDAIEKILKKLQKQ